MKRIISAAMAVAIFGCVSAAYASDEMKAIVASYLEIHAALAADQLEGIKPAARAVAAQAAKFGPAGDDLVKAAKAVEQAPDLKGARDAFSSLSDAVILAGRAHGWQDLSGIKVGFCPMVKRSWVQKEGAVSNPYYGKSMSTCGTLSDPRK